MKIIDFLRRYIKNLITLNNLKFRIDRQEEQNEVLKREIQDQQQQIQDQQQQIQDQQQQIQDQQQQIQDQQQQIQDQQQQIQDQQQQIQDQQQQLTTLKNELENTKNAISQEMDFKLAELMLHHSLSLHHRIDQFIFDANIELKNSINSPDEKLSNIAIMATKISDEQ